MALWEDLAAQRSPESLVPGWVGEEGLPRGSPSGAGSARVPGISSGEQGGWFSWGFVFSPALEEIWQD